MAVAAIFAGISAVSSLFGGIGAKRDAQQGAYEVGVMTDKRVKNIQKETDEQLRRFDQDVAKTMGKGQATAGASGFGEGSSLDTYLGTMEQEYAAERDWTAQVGRQRAEMARLEGDYQQASVKSGGRSAFNQGVGGMFGGLTQTANLMSW